MYKGEFNYFHTASKLPYSFHFTTGVVRTAAWIRRLRRKTLKRWPQLIYENHQPVTPRKRKFHRLSALDILESRLGRGWKSPRRLWWCDDGLIRAAKARFTKSPSTDQIRTSEFVIADLRAFNRLGEYEIEGVFFTFLCILHLNEPGCVVGEHKHVLFGICFRTTWSRWDTAMERRGEMDLSMENLTLGVEFTGARAWRFTRVGEADRLKHPVDGEE